MPIFPPLTSVVGLCVASVLPLISQQTRSEKLWAEILVPYNDVQNPSAGSVRFETVVCSTGYEKRGLVAP